LEQKTLDFAKRVRKDTEQFEMLERHKDIKKQEKVMHAHQIHMLTNQATQAKTTS